MRRKYFESQILDCLEGRLKSSEQEQFERALSESEEFQSLFEEYKKIVQVEEKIASEAYSLSPGFTAKVMEEIESSPSGFLRSIGDMTLHILDTTSKKIAWSSIATAAVLLLCFGLFLNKRDDGFLPEKQDELSLSGGLATTYNDIRVPTSGVSGVLHGMSEGLQELFSSDKDEGNEKQVLRVEAPIEVEEGDSRLRGSKGGELKKKEIFADFSSQAATRSLANDSARVGGIEEISPPAPGVAKDFYQRRPADVYQVPPAQNRERYGQWQENPFINVGDESISTFSIDVDTGSYTNARRFLRAGSLPPTDAVRIEEFINYFDYQYPQNTEQPFALNYELAPAPLEPEKVLLKLGIQAKDSIQSEKPWHLTFLIDVSGSMHTPDKLDLVKKSLFVLLNNMREGDKVSVVTYAGNAGVLLEGASITDKAKIKHAIENLHAGGSTHGSAGILEAYRIAQSLKIKDGVNRVILATDGDFNVGTSNTDELIKLIEEKRNSGITLTTVGFGSGNYNEAMMEQVANKGNGNYFYIDSFKEARKVFEKDLMGTIEVVAKDVKLQIEFNPEHVASFRLIGYENRKLRKEDFNNDKIDAGEIGSGHTVTALYELVLTGTELAERQNVEYRYQQPKKESAVKKTAPMSPELAFLKVRYKDPEGSRSKLLKFPIEKSRITETPSEDFRFAAAVSYFAHVLRKSDYLGEYTLSDIAALAKGSLGKDEQGLRREFLELVENARALNQQ